LNSLISLVVPCYNESETIEDFLKITLEVLKSTDLRYELIFINDGSSDNTVEVLQKWQEREKSIVIVDFSRNFGKEAALTAGLDVATGDAVIPIDSDLQDPPHIIPQMVEKWREGFQVVLAKRADRSSDSTLKRITASAFYKLHNIISDSKIPNNVGDFRLIDRSVVEAIKMLPERRRFMKGIFSWVGFESCVVEYTRDARFAGESKFSGWKLWNFALEGITSFSTVPLRIWTYLGLIISLFSFLYASFIVLKTLIFGVDLPGYASILTVVLFLGGIQLIGIGIVGEYVGRIYMESKNFQV
jgi:glycosyltransferase involved in cell wall biosynthesis